MANNTLNSSTSTTGVKDPVSSWDSFLNEGGVSNGLIGKLTEYSPTNIENMFAAASGSNINQYISGDSEWYLDKIFENPYISSTLYFNQTAMGEAKTKSGNNFLMLNRCIVRPLSFTVDNRFDSTGATPGSMLKVAMFENMRSIMSLTRSPIAKSLNMNSSFLQTLIEGFVKDREKEGRPADDFMGTVATNALVALKAFDNMTTYLNSVQFESDAKFSRAFIASSVHSPVHATFFFVQDKDTGATNRQQAAELLKYFLPYQKLYTSWKDLLTEYNPEGEKIITDVETSINNIASRIGVETGLETVKDLTNTLFNGGVITTMAPGGYKTDNAGALTAAMKGIQDKRTFMLTTPWGMRTNLLPSNIQITESPSKVICKTNKVVPLFIQIDVDFVSSRRLLSEDVISHVSGKYNITDFKSTGSVNKSTSGATGTTSNSGTESNGGAS